MGQTLVNMSFLGANLSPANFAQPLAFAPERWLDDGPAEFKNDNKAAFQPFSVGTRNCIGRNLAYAEMNLILAKVLWQFDLDLDAKRTGDWFGEFTHFLNPSEACANHVVLFSRSTCMGYLA